MLRSQRKTIFGFFAGSRSPVSVGLMKPMDCRQQTFYNFNADRRNRNVFLSGQKRSIGPEVEKRNTTTKAERISRFLQSTVNGLLLKELKGRFVNKYGLHCL